MSNPNIEPVSERPEVSFTLPEIVCVDSFTSELHRQLGLAVLASRTGKDFATAYQLSVERYAKAESERVYAAGMSDSVKLIVMAEGFGASRKDFYLQGYHAELAANRLLTSVDISTLTSLSGQTNQYRQQGASEDNVASAVSYSLAHELAAIEREGGDSSVRKLALLAYGAGATLQVPGLGYAGFLHEALKDKLIT